jgi:hypothetical protein
MATSEREASGLAYVCANASDLRSILEEKCPDSAPVLESVLAAVRDGKAVTQLLDELHQALQRAGDELGVYGEYGGQDRGPEAAGTERMEIVFRCPLKKCMGRPFDEVTQFPPHCSVSGAELIRDRLL